MGCDDDDDDDDDDDVNMFSPAAGAQEATKLSLAQPTGPSSAA